MTTTNPAPRPLTPAQQAALRRIAETRAITTAPQAPAKRLAPRSRRHSVSHRGMR